LRDAIVDIVIAIIGVSVGILTVLQPIILQRQQWRSQQQKMRHVIVQCTLSEITKVPKAFLIVDSYAKALRNAIDVPVVISVSKINKGTRCDYIVSTERVKDPRWLPWSKSTWQRLNSMVIRDHV